MLLLREFVHQVAGMYKLKLQTIW